MSGNVKGRLRKLEKAEGGTEVVYKVWRGFGPRPTLKPGDTRTLVVIERVFVKPGETASAESGTPEEDVNNP